MEQGSITDDIILGDICHFLFRVFSNIHIIVDSNSFYTFQESKLCFNQVAQTPSNIRLEA